jgi:hypothetical protein
MKHTIIKTFVLAALVALAPFLSALGLDEESVKIFSGEPRLLIVHGYSTSQHWWAFLQRKIDRHMGGPGRRSVEVRLCNKGGTPIARWMNLQDGTRSAAWERMLTPVIRAEKGKRPVIVLAQQSLQSAYPEGRTAVIRNADDKDRIRRGADAIEKYANLILEDGADTVVVGMHIYKRPMEPEIGNERLALAEFMKRKPARVEAGPDIWTPTSKRRLLAFDTDKIHPHFIGVEIMAHCWFETLLEREGIEVPAWSRGACARRRDKKSVEGQGGSLEPHSATLRQGQGRQIERGRACRV